MIFSIRIDGEWVVVDVSHDLIASSSKAEGETPVTTE